MLRSSHKKRQQTVVLLHGLGRTAGSMEKVGQALRDEGYRIVNLDYPSTREAIGVLAKDHLKPVVDRITSAGQTVHFVTHSLGGILVRSLMAEHGGGKVGKVVMLSPPNQGSEVAEHLQHNPLYRNFLGPAGQELGLAPDATPLQLGAADFDLGIICGGRTSDPWFAALFNGPNDGKVSVARARLAGMNDFLVLPHGHTFIMQQPDVILQVSRYLDKGSFSHSNSSSRLRLPPTSHRLMARGSSLYQAWKNNGFSLN